MKNKKLIEAVVNWWAEKLEKPAVEGLSGDTTSQESLFALYAKVSLQNKEVVNDETISTFKKFLTEILEKYEGGRMCLSTDYAPEFPLSEVCEKSGISGIQFPQKMLVYINFETNTATFSQVRGMTGKIYPKE